MVKDKLKAIIIEDEKGVRDVLHKLLNTYSQQLEVVGAYANLLAAIEPIKLQQPDLVFVDVQMPDHYGYEIVHFFDTIDFEIIFVTAHDQYAVKAFEVNAIDYILKPIDRQRLAEAIARVRERLQAKSQLSNYRKLQRFLDTQTIYVYESEKKHRINTHDIIAIQAKGAYSTIHLAHQPALLVSKNLRHFEELTDDSFFRSHKSWLVNTQRIQEFIPKTNTIVLSKGITAKLSKYKRSQFKKHFG